MVLRPRLWLGGSWIELPGCGPSSSITSSSSIEGSARSAAAIVEPRRTKFDDILVYVHRVGGSRGMAARRVEWTPRGGYEEIVY